MARTSFYAPAHRVMGRVSLGSGGAAQPSGIGPSLDAVGSGLQDARLPWNTGSSSTGAQVCGWYNPGNHPCFDLVPATLSVVNIAAAAAGVANTPLTLVSVSGTGVIVSSSALLMFPSLLSVPAAAVFADALPLYRAFGGSSQRSVVYDAGTCMARAVTIHSAGDDHLGTATVVGYDQYGYLTHAQVTLANAGNVTTTKAFKAVVSITPAGTLSGGNISAGFSDTYGLPFYAAGASAIWGYWNNLILAGAGTFVAGVTTNPATALTGDVRGTYIPGSASDGAKRLTLFQHPSIATMVGAAGINVGMFGVAQA